MRWSFGVTGASFDAVELPWQTPEKAPRQRDVQSAAVRSAEAIEVMVRVPFLFQPILIGLGPTEQDEAKILFHGSRIRRAGKNAVG
jgi:hypothetical protein